MVDQAAERGSAPFSPLIEHAIELSSQWHDRTYRKSRWRNPAFPVPTEETLKVPVVSHLTAVAFTVQRANWEDEVVAAALLHDIIEDGNAHGDAFRYNRLCTLVGREVADLVLAVTEEKVSDDGQLIPWRQRKMRYADRLDASGSAPAMAISLADKLHNLWSINGALSNGIDVFVPGPNRQALSAGPMDQRWFYKRICDISETMTDGRLDGIRQQLQMELARFVEATRSRSAT